MKEQLIKWINSNYRRGTEPLYAWVDAADLLKFIKSLESLEPQIEGECCSKCLCKHHESDYEKTHCVSIDCLCHSKAPSSECLKHDHPPGCKCNVFVDLPEIEELKSNLSGGEEMESLRRASSNWPMFEKINEPVRAVNRLGK